MQFGLGGTIVKTHSRPRGIAHFDLCTSIRLKVNVSPIVRQSRALVCILLTWTAGRMIIRFAPFANVARLYLRIVIFSLPLSSRSEKDLRILLADKLEGRKRSRSAVLFYVKSNITIFTNEEYSRWRYTAVILLCTFVLELRARSSLSSRVSTLTSANRTSLAERLNRVSSAGHAIVQKRSRVPRTRCRLHDRGEASVKKKSQVLRCSIIVYVI